MTFGSYLFMAFSFLIPHLGTIVVSAVSLIFAVLKRRELGRVSYWACWGFGLFLGYVLVSAIARTVITVLRIQSGADPSDPVFTVWLAVSNIGTGLLYLAAFMILARAIFLDRNKAPDTA